MVQWYSWEFLHFAPKPMTHNGSVLREYYGKIIEKGTIQQLYKSENEVVQNLLKAAYLNG